MLLCTFCGSDNTIRRGKSDRGEVRFRCKNCGHWGRSGISRHARPAKILLLDIETLPGEYYSFDAKVEYLAPIMQIKDWSISCWSAKWLFDDKIMGEAVTPQEATDREDHSILPGIWKLMDEAHIVVTQNGIEFDLKKLNTRFLKYHMKPPTRFLNVDTLKVSRSIFGNTYNRLDELGQKFGIGKKIDMTMKDWKLCLTNDRSAKQALGRMLEYCKNDIAPLLEDVYLNMLPYIPNHPNLNLYSTSDQDICRNCGSTHLLWTGKEYPTPQGLWQAWRCETCGAQGRGTGKIHKIRGTSVV